VIGTLTWVNLAILALAWLTFRWIYRRRALSRMPEIPDEEFLLRFAMRFSAPPDRVLQARRRVSKVLGLSERKLAPEYTHKDLARQVQLLGDFGIAWEDLEERVADAAWRAGPPGAPRPTEAVGACPTVGDLVAGLIQAQVAAPPAGSVR
jgi:hypothetical protein